MAIIGAVAFSEFFVLSLYLQDILGYSAMQGGVAFVAFAGTVVVVSNLAQVIVARIGARATLTAGLLPSALSVALLIRLPVDGHYFWDLFPAFVLGGAGMGLSFVPVTILGLAGVGRADAGVASGLINTSRQIGGAIGIAASARSRQPRPLATAKRPATSLAALDHGYQTALAVLAGLLLLGAAVAALFVRTADRRGRADAPPCPSRRCSTRPPEFARRRERRPERASHAAASRGRAPRRDCSAPAAAVRPQSVRRRPAGLRPLKAELAAIRHELAEVTDAATTLRAVA